MGFDTTKWFKQQYLKESLAQDLLDMDDASLLSTYENKLKVHDWYYYMSDDSRRYNSGRLEGEVLTNIKAELEKRGLADEAKELFDTYKKTR
jgi:hypothetical protein